MLAQKNNRPILVLSIPLFFLIVIVSIAGMFVSGTYSAETADWKIQSVAQDQIDLFVISPLLLVTAMLAYRGNTMGTHLWAGTNLYLIYTFVIYCFSIHFNNLFLVYCFALGLSFYSFLYFIFYQSKNPHPDFAGSKAAVKSTAVYFIVIAGLFYLL